MKTRKYLTCHEVKRIIVAAKSVARPERDACLILMCFIHRCRVSEIIHWRLSDIDLNSNRIYVHRLKNGFSTIHPIYHKEREALHAWLEVRSRYLSAGGGWLFLCKKGGAISRQRIHEIIRACSIRAGLTIEAHPHMLRHGCGFALADKGMDTRLIQDYLGHRNIQHTVLYTASNSRRFEEVW